MPPANRSSRSASLPATSRQGFTLVEMGMVTLIVGVLASLAMPALKRTLIAARASAVASDLRTFAAAFQAYEQQNGRWPPEAAAGVMPPLMAGSLGHTAWLRVTPVGGLYDWEYNRRAAGVRYRAGIGIRTRNPHQVTKDSSQLLAIDRLIDDGNLASGNFFLGPGNEPFLAVER